MCRLSQAVFLQSYLPCSSQATAWSLDNKKESIAACRPGLFELVWAELLQGRGIFLPTLSYIEWQIFELLHNTFLQIVVFWQNESFSAPYFKLSTSSALCMTWKH